MCNEWPVVGAVVAGVRSQPRCSDSDLHKLLIQSSALSLCLCGRIVGYYEQN